MGIVGWLVSITPEQWAIIGGGVGGIAASVVKGKKLWVEWTERRAYNRRKMEERIVAAVSKVAATSIVDEVDAAIDQRNNTIARQTIIAKIALDIYTEKVLVTAPDAVVDMLCQNGCNDVDMVTELYTNAIRSTFSGDVLEYFVYLINANGLKEKSLDEYKTWARGHVTKKAFDAFITSMRKRFHSQKIRLRIDWIENNMGCGMMSDTVEGIMLEIREESIRYHAGREKRKIDICKQFESSAITELGKV